MIDSSAEKKSLLTAFISIKEQFDTSTPMGRAMMNIAAVFAQLERETIAERIKDNMYQQAKSDRWTGGTTPLGYKSVMHTSADADGKSRKYYTLEIDEDEIELVKLIFSKYSEIQSVNATEKLLNETKNYARNGKVGGKSNVKRILTNPIYCIADKDSLEYFTALAAISALMKVIVMVFREFFRITATADRREKKSRMISGSLLYQLTKDFSAEKNG